MQQVKKFLLECFSSAGQYISGSAYANSTLKDRGGDDAKQPIHNPNVCFLGTTTPKAFWRVCGAGSADDGFLPRTIAFNYEPDSCPIIVKPEADFKNPPQELIELCREITRPKAAGNIAGNAGTVAAGNRPYPTKVVPYGPGAEAAFWAFRQECANKAFCAKGVAGGFWNRANEHATKIALIVAVGVDPNDPTITLDVLRIGQQIATLCVRRFIAEAADRLAENDFQSEHLEIKRMIDGAGRGGISANEIGEAVRGHIRGPRRQEILDELVAHRLAFESTPRIGKVAKRGRPSKRYISAKYAPKLIS